MKRTCDICAAEMTPYEGGDLLPRYRCEGYDKHPIRDLCKACEKEVNDFHRSVHSRALAVTMKIVERASKRMLRLMRRRNLLAEPRATAKPRR